jgi:hypothetical protein
MTWDGRILWEVKHPDHNHDGIRLRNSNLMLICQKPVPNEIAAKVQGGRRDRGHRPDRPPAAAARLGNGEIGGRPCPSRATPVGYFRH